jgi:hypothetical protein
MYNTLMGKYLLIRRPYRIQEIKAKELNCAQKINVHRRGRPPEAMSIDKFIRNKHSITSDTGFRYFIVIYNNFSHLSRVDPDYKDAFYFI